MINIYMNTSREYAKFKRTFVGPILPKKIAKEREIYYKSMPAEKPPRSDFGRKKSPPCEFDDWRLTRHNYNVKSLVRPNWADRNKIKQIYAAAKKLTETTGVRHHVDHIIPLRHPLVCGLHVENNLRVISAQDNIEKSNYFIIE